MKILENIFLRVLFISVCLCLWLGSANAADVNYIGEFCATLQSGYGDPGKTLQLGALSYGSEHLPLHGKLTDEGSSQPMSVEGSALRDGDNYSITLTSSGVAIPNKERFSIIFYLSLNADTLSGTYTSIEEFLVGTGAPQPRNAYSVSIDRGTITPSPCP